MKLNICFFITDHELLEQRKKIRDKVSNSMENEFDSEPVHNEKYVKTKIKYYERKFCTNVHNDK